MLSVSLDCLVFIASSVFSNVYLLVCSVVLFYRMLSVSLDCLFFIASSVFSSVYLLVCSVSCVLNVVSVSGLSFFYCIFGYSLTFIY